MILYREALDRLCVRLNLYLVLPIILVLVGATSSNNALRLCRFRSDRDEICH